MAIIKTFPMNDIKSWEEDFCVNFSIALERLTGWLLHIDWFTDAGPNSDSFEFYTRIPLRAYVADNHDNIFDPRGHYKIDRFSNLLIRPLAAKAFKKNKLDSSKTWAVSTKFYSEDKLKQLHLPKPPDESKIYDAMVKISNNSEYLSAISKRSEPRIPAYLAGTFTYGRCAPYAEALKDLCGLAPVALLVSEFLPMYEGTPKSKDGYVHSFVQHTDTVGEDAWGIQDISMIAARFGAKKYSIDADIHNETVTKLKINSPSLYTEAYEDAKKLIGEYRVIY